MPSYEGAFLKRLETEIPDIRKTTNANNTRILLLEILTSAIVAELSDDKKERVILRLKSLQKAFETGSKEGRDESLRRHLGENAAECQRLIGFVESNLKSGDFFSILNLVLLNQEQSKTALA